MENRVFILFYILAALSFVFGISARFFLRIREKKKLRVPALLWLLLFLTALLPILTPWKLFRLRLFTDYTGGMRIEIHRDTEEAEPVSEIYLTRGTLRFSRRICGGILAAWLAGSVSFFSYGISSYLNSLRFLTRHSEVCHDERVNAIFERARKKAGLLRPVSLRLMQSELRISPCTCGIVFPSVFIGRDYPDEYSEMWLELLFLHELTHLRRHDPELKLLTLAATSVEAVLPVSWRIRAAVGEDTEYLCDAAVLRLMGKDARRDYISLIVDIAERNMRSDVRTDDLLSAASASSRFLVKRYENMLAPSRGFRAAKLLPMTAAAALLNFCLISFVTVVNPDNLGLDFASPFLEKTVCSYFRLSDPGELTERHLTAVYSVEFRRLDGTEEEQPGCTGEGKYIILCTLNEGLVPGEAETPANGGEGCVCRSDTRVVDTRDLLLFRDLRTLIFSDSLESSEEAVWTDVPYAVIRRK